MANLCSNTICFFSKDKVAITKLKEELEKATSSIHLAGLNDIESGWIANVLAYFGLNHQKYETGGEVGYISKKTSKKKIGNETYYFFTMDDWTKWRPMVEGYKDIAKMFGDIEFYYSANEPGCRYFENTDHNRNFLKEDYEVIIENYDEYEEMFNNSSFEMEITIMADENLNKTIKEIKEICPEADIQIYEY